MTTNCASDLTGTTQKKKKKEKKNILIHIDVLHYDTRLSVVFRRRFATERTKQRQRRRKSQCESIHSHISMSYPVISSGIEQTLLETTFATLNESQQSYDVVIQFHAAEVNQLRIIVRLLFLFFVCFI